jgi:hypothetical protein
MVFLDQEKAFDMVGFKTIRTVFRKLNWPKRFTDLINVTYKEDRVRARVLVNGEVSMSDFPINSGTRQGCPLSPLIFAVIADLFNMAIIRSESFKGHETTKGFFVKISAYADDTGVHLGSLTDIQTYKVLLKEYSRATGGVTNFRKSEAVLLGKWRNNPPDLGVRTVAASKYLGICTGDSPSMRAQAIENREAKVYRQMEYWNTRLQSSPTDRAMIAKIMLLSIVWYHAGVMPDWEAVLLRIEKAVNTFIWKNSIPKVAVSTLRMEKDDGGLDTWALIPKAWAFQSMWIAKHVNRKLNPILTNTLDAIVGLYGEKAGTDIPLWESRVDHSSNILEEVGSPLLAALQRAWTNIIRRDPDLQRGDWVIYSDAEIPGKRQADQAYIGVAEVTSPLSKRGRKYRQTGTPPRQWNNLSSWTTQQMERHGTCLKSVAIESKRNLPPLT